MYTNWKRLMLTGINFLFHAWLIFESCQFGPPGLLSAFNKMRACVSLRAEAFPVETNCCSVWRPCLVNSTIYFFFITDIFTNSLPLWFCTFLGRKTKKTSIHLWKSTRTTVMKIALFLIIWPLLSARKSKNHPAPLFYRGFPIYHQFHFVLIHSMSYNTKLPLKTQALRQLLPNTLNKNRSTQAKSWFQSRHRHCLGMLLTLLLQKLTNFWWIMVKMNEDYKQSASEVAGEEQGIYHWRLTQNWYWLYCRTCPYIVIPYPAVQVIRISSW